MNHKEEKVSKRRVKLIHDISVLCIFLSLLFAGLSFSLDGYILSYFLVGIAIVFFITSKLSKKGNPTIARCIFMITFNLSIAITASYFGSNSSIEFLLLYAIGLSFILFSFRRELYLVIIFSLISILFWVALYLTNFNVFYSSDIEADVVTTYIYPFSMTVTLILVAFQLSYFSYINAGFNKGLHSKKQEAIDASNAKSTFLSTMSHEIRTPLNAVIGLSHILEDNKPRKDQVENIEALNYSGKILLNLLNNVLDFSKMDSTEIELDKTPTNLPLALKQIKKIHETGCIQKGIVMNLDIDKDMPIVWLDVVRYNQVVNNLVTNAIKFTDKGSVTLRIKKLATDNDKINILTEIIDTGIGIPLDKQETIWEVFTQASATTNRLYGGTGLGLPIAKSIIESMGSKIHIDSEIGKGSRFYFEADLKIASNLDLKENNLKREHNFIGKKVLLVEDNLINIMVGKQILEKALLTVEVAKNGVEAIDMVKENSYDIVLMDIQMPVMDGYTASKEIRKFNKKLPIIALSASVFIEVKDKIKDCGMNGFIVKPFDPEDLLNRIEDAINT
ncbi:MULTISPECIES: response regulator [unclassified Polaribacter]|uniref:response regulator n=1 Tax=unclassified Polaribacter TaxID=196858 RepID=UPI0011BEAC76|nr:MULTISPECIES: response regulator [unclassified Polaribacter]TXD50250.1 response regulator [Polaribacter sp. IC063]TXD56254.1 response regulator [Polaribacter sp. IC066]